MSNADTEIELKAQNYQCGLSCCTTPIQVINTRKSGCTAHRDHCHKRVTFWGLEHVLDYLFVWGCSIVGGLHCSVRD